MGTMFLSYRHSDSVTVSGHIYDRLVQTFGQAAVFKDVYTIPAGVNFARYIDAQVRKCSVLLAIIGPEWLTSADASGAKRLDDPNDFVRLEIELALTRKIPIIPLLVSGATMPPAQLLPPPLRNLSLQEALPVRSQPDFDGDMARLALALTRWVKPVVPLAPLAGTAVGHPVPRAAVSFGIPIGAVAFVVAYLATVFGNENQSPLILLGAVFAGFLFICYYFAGVTAARHTGLTASGTSAGLLTGVVGALLGGPVLGGIIGASSSLTANPSGSTMLEMSGICIGALLLPALVAGAAFGALGGRLGSRRYLANLTRR